jgi:hypothetical protein
MEHKLALALHHPAEPASGDMPVRQGCGGEAAGGARVSRASPEAGAYRPWQGTRTSQHHSRGAALQLPQHVPLSDPEPSARALRMPATTGDRVVFPTLAAMACHLSDVSVCPVGTLMLLCIWVLASQRWKGQRHGLIFPALWTEAAGPAPGRMMSRAECMC